jgi:hypothetical protein
MVHPTSAADVKQTLSGKGRRKFSEDNAIVIPQILQRGNSICNAKKQVYNNQEICSYLRIRPTIINSR